MPGTVPGAGGIAKNKRPKSLCQSVCILVRTQIDYQSTNINNMLDGIKSYKTHPHTHTNPQKTNALRG